MRSNNYLKVGKYKLGKRSKSSPLLGDHTSIYSCTQGTYAEKPHIRAHVALLLAIQVGCATCRSTGHAGWWDVRLDVPCAICLIRPMYFLTLSIWVDKTGIEKWEVDAGWKKYNMYIPINIIQFGIRTIYILCVHISFNPLKKTWPTHMREHVEI